METQINCHYDVHSELLGEIILPNHSLGKSHHCDQPEVLGTVCRFIYRFVTRTHIELYFQYTRIYMHLLHIYVFSHI